MFKKVFFKLSNSLDILVTKSIYLRFSTDYFLDETPPLQWNSDRSMVQIVECGGFRLLGSIWEGGWVTPTTPEYS